MEARLASNQKVAGSSPVWSFLILRFVKVSSHGFSLTPFNLILALNIQLVAKIEFCKAPRYSALQVSHCDPLE